MSTVEEIKQHIENGQAIVQRHRKGNSASRGMLMERGAIPKTLNGVDTTVVIESGASPQHNGVNAMKVEL